MSYIFVLLSQAARLISALNLLQRRAGNNRCKTSLQRLLYQMLAEAQLSIEEPWKVAGQRRIDLGALNGAVLGSAGQRLFQFDFAAARLGFCCHDLSDEVS